MKLVIEIPDKFAEGFKESGLTDDEATLLIRDAFGEFASARHPVSDYVSKRYKGQSVSFQEKKIAEVMKRVTWATFLKCGEIKVVE